MKVNFFFQIQGKNHALVQWEDNQRNKNKRSRLCIFANRLAVPRRILDFCGRLPIYKVEDVAMMDTDASITDMPGIKKSKPQVIFRESK